MPHALPPAGTHRILGSRDFFLAPVVVFGVSYEDGDSSPRPNQSRQNIPS